MYINACIRGWGDRVIKERRKESNESFVCKSGEMVVGYSDDIDNIEELKQQV